MSSSIFSYFLESVVATIVEFKYSEYFDIIPISLSVSNGRRLGAITGKGYIMLLDLEIQNIEVEEESSNKDISTISS